MPILRQDAPCKTIDPGELRQSVTILQYSEVQDAFGGVTLTSSNFATGVRAKVEFLPGNEDYEALEKVAVVRAKFTFRFVSGLSHKMKISFDGSDYDIKGMRHFGRNLKEWTEVLTELNLYS